MRSSAITVLTENFKNNRKVQACDRCACYKLRAHSLELPQLITIDTRIHKRSLSETPFVSDLLDIPLIDRSIRSCDIQVVAVVEMLAVRTPAPWLPCLRSVNQLTRPPSAIISGGTHSSLSFGLRASSESANKPVSAKLTPMAGVPATETGASTNASTAWNKPCAEKWTGGVHLILNCNLDAAWSLQSDFMGLPKWVPTISVSRLVEGEANAVGCVRYCKGSSTIWVHERLLEMDEAKHYMSYRMEENHFVFPQGFQGYVAKVQLGEAGEGQTWVNWTYEVDPVISATREQVTQFMIEFYSGSLKFLEDGANKLVAENSEAAKSMTTSLSNVLPAQTAPVQAA